MEKKIKKLLLARKKTYKAKHHQSYEADWCMQTIISDLSRLLKEAEEPPQE